MNLHKVQCFLAVDLTRNFSEAAEVLYTTQSSVSKQISSLEKDIGMPLFKRDTRNIQLTPSGEIFRTFAKRYLDLYNEMRDSLQSIRDLPEQTLLVGVFPVIAQYGIPKLFRAFRKAYPNVNLQVSDCEAVPMLAELDQGHFDIGIMRKGSVPKAKYCTLPLCNDQLVAILPKTHCLAAQATVALSSLQKEDFVFLGKETLLHQLCEKACVRAGFEPKVVYISNRTENLLEMVNAGMGVALLMEIPARYALPNTLVALPLKEQINSPVVMTRPRNYKPNAAADLFWCFVRENHALLEEILRH